MSISANGARTDVLNTQIVPTSQQNSSHDLVAANPEQQQKPVTQVAPVISHDLQKQATDSETIGKKLIQVNKALDELSQKFEYRLVREKGMDVVQLYDKDNKKVLYQIPSEGILDVVDKLQNATGLVIDLKR
jgi:uncharacterized FlaG/YvyC family protein